MYQVLIADPDRASRDLLMQALSVDNCSIKAVCSGEEVLQEIAKKETDVLIVEVHLPDIPAWELVPQVREIASEVSIVAVTEDDCWEISRRVRVTNGPVFFYGLKPLNLREMQDVVRYAVQWRQRQGNQIESMLITAQ
ncbi:MAG: response regulator [Candidatus Latescibacteria bacterium]|jgi:DNA-binding NtrC family response regulator|nr:response regulator [Candidatus Latescibacterota bacterium]